MQLVEARLENDLVLALVVFSLQYILVNHEYWKYKVKHVRWKVTLKVCVILCQLQLIGSLSCFISTFEHISHLFLGPLYVEMVEVLVC